jgi:hypothetical protein
MESLLGGTSGFLFVFVIALWTAVKVAYAVYQRRRAKFAQFKLTCRADGKKYPPGIEGVCSECSRGGSRIYFPQETNNAYCTTCYEVYWRKNEGLEAVCPKPAER